MGSEVVPAGTSSICRVLLSSFIFILLFPFAEAVPHRNSGLRHHHHHKRRTENQENVGLPVCRNPPGIFDFSVKNRRHESIPLCLEEDLPSNSDSSQLSDQKLRASRSGAPEGTTAVGSEILETRSIPVIEDYSCSENRECPNKACCSKATGYCNYGPEACGTNGISPNDNCWSNCDAKAECGRHSDPPNKLCPLNVCCSEHGFCGMTEDFCAADKGCQSNCFMSPGDQSGSSNGDVRKRVIGYYETWLRDRRCQGMTIDQIPAGSLDYLFFSFAYVWPDTFDIVPMDDLPEYYFSDITAVKKRNPSLKVMVALGGWTHNDNHTTTQPSFSDMVSTKANRSKFIGNVIRFMRTYAFDGVDFDWEYPGAGDRGGKPEDGVNFTQLLKELNEALANADRPKDNPYISSFTVPTSYWYLKNFDLAAVKHVDFVNVMSYDLHGDQNNQIGSYVYAHTNWTEIDLALGLLWRNHVPPSKLNLGVGFYGRSFQLADPTCSMPGCPFLGGASEGSCSKNSGTLTYREIQDIIKSKGIEKPFHDKVNAVKYIHWDHDQWVSFDDKETIKEKLKRADDRGIGGVLIWAIDQDDDNLDALASILDPRPVKVSSKNSQDSSVFAKDQAPEKCELSPCRRIGDPLYNKCEPGYTVITTNLCDGSASAPMFAPAFERVALCCPKASAPNPDDCRWRGQATVCNGQCHPGEMTMFQHKAGDGWACTSGNKVYCCKVPEAEDFSVDGSSINRCLVEMRQGVADSCLHGSDYKHVTFFREGFAGVGNICCPKTVMKQLKNCQWRGNGDCTKNTCLPNEIMLASHSRGEGKSCPLSRKRAFCCETTGVSPFDGSSLPVPLVDLFPSPPTGDTVDVTYSLNTDNTWGGDVNNVPTKDSPNENVFEFIVMTAPEQIHANLRKRDGSHWDVFNCLDAESEEEQTVQMVCTDSSPDSNCGRLLLGNGAPGTIVELPDGCGPGKYAVVKDFSIAANQSLPLHLQKRDFGNEHQPVVHDLTFDYLWKRVDPEFSDGVQLRVDVSNIPGYWDRVVKAAKPSNPNARKRSLVGDDPRSHKRWLEEEWRDDVISSEIDSTKDELHKRWFTLNPSTWISRFSDLEFSLSKSHKLQTEANVVVVDDKWECIRNGVNLDGRLRVSAAVEATVNVGFGITIITKYPFTDIKKSYLVFDSSGQVNVKAMADLSGRIRLNMTGIEVPGLEQFRNAQFRVPGVMTLGPKFKITSGLSLDYSGSVRIDAKAVLSDWNIRQTYPDIENVAPGHPDNDSGDGDFEEGTQKVQFDMGVRSNGRAVVTFTPSIEFEIRLDSSLRNIKDVDIPTSSGLLAQVSVEAEVGLILQTIGDSRAPLTGDCPFEYGLAGSLEIRTNGFISDRFGWNPKNYALRTKQVKTLTGTDMICAVGGNNNLQRRDYSIPDDSSTQQLEKRTPLSFGPVFTADSMIGACGCATDEGSGGEACPLLMMHTEDEDDWDFDEVDIDSIVADSVRLHSSSGGDAGSSSSQAGEPARRLAKRVALADTYHLCGSKVSSKLRYYTRPYSASSKLFLDHHNAAHTDTYLIYGPTDPPAGTSKCNHFGSGWLTMPPATTKSGDIGSLYATEHILEKGLLKKFFEHLEKHHGAIFPAPLSSTSATAKSKVCGFVKRYWQEPESKGKTASPPVVPEWIFKKNSNTCMAYTVTRWFGNIWPGNNIAGQKEDLHFKRTELPLLSARANLIKAAMLQGISLPNTKKKKMDSDISNDLKNVWENLRGTLIAWRYLMTPEVQTIFNAQTNRIARLLDDFETTTSEYSFTNPNNKDAKTTFKRLKLKPYQSQSFKDKWITYMDHVFADAKIRSEAYVAAYVKQLELTLTSTANKATLAAFKTAWAARPTWSYTTTYTTALVMDMPFHCPPQTDYDG